MPGFMAVSLHGRKTSLTKFQAEGFDAQEKLFARWLESFAET
jgi:hypothetical protein